jgi:putative ATPase
MSAQAHLFDDPSRPSTPPALTPLAARMRPRSLDEILGQEHLLAPGRALRRVLESSRA